MLRRFSVHGKGKPAYPDVDEVNQDRRGFLRKLGGGVLGMTLVGLGVGCRTSGDIAPPPSQVPAGKTGSEGDPNQVVPPEPPPLPGEPMVPPKPTVLEPDEPVLGGKTAPEPQPPELELRKPGEMPALNPPTGNEEPDVVEEKDTREDSDRIPVLGGVIAPPPELPPPPQPPQK